jgi:hypothetical protein
MVWKNIHLDHSKLKRCEACGHFFTCATDGDCWCHDYQIDRTNMMLLMQKYNDCICQKCLKKYESL